MDIGKRLIVLGALAALPFLSMAQSCYGLQTDENKKAPDQKPEVVQEKTAKHEAPKVTVPNTPFLRLQTDEYQNAIALQTATAKYVRKNEQGEIELEVFLEGVIHIADTSYYRGFQQRFERYDTVLHESVIENTGATGSAQKKKLSGLGLNILQQLSSGTLGLSYQADEINYDVGNLLHADLSRLEISELMKERGDDRITMVADLLAHIIKQISNPEEPNIDNSQGSESREGENQETPSRVISIDLKVLTDPNGIMKIRRMMASALVDSKLLESSLPPSIHKMIIGDRNDRAMAFLLKEKGKGKKRIAIFFGVGHMQDLENRLVTQHGMELDSVNWRNAWDLRDGSIEGAPLEGLVESAFRDSFKNKMRLFARGLRNKDDTASDNKTDDAKDEKIDSLEKTLKALEAKLNRIENEDKQGEQSEDKQGEQNEDKQNEGEQGGG